MGLHIKLVNMLKKRGGVIFHSYKDGVNENYLVVSIDDQSTGTTWSNITNQLAGADSTWNGLENSLTITGQTGHTESAAQLCLEYVNGGCDTISVTYTLEGEEPVTVVVEWSYIFNGKKAYEFSVNGDDSTLRWNGTRWDYYFGTTLYLEEDTDCPFGTYTIPGGSIFTSFSVAPVNPIDDWYLPAIDELSLLWQNRFNVNRTLSGNSSAGTIPGTPTQIGYNNYWSSTESDTSAAWSFFFNDGYVYSYLIKNDTLYVRAVRKFSI